MKKTNLVVLMTGMLLLSSSTLYAQTKFSVVPTSGTVTSILLPNNFTETPSYVVTNQTTITRTLTMVPITGVTQITTGGGCPGTFTLAPQQSCILKLSVNGSQVPTSGINGGPVICKTKSATDSSPDPLLCSQPAVTDLLAISVTTTGQHAYIANQLNNSISFCQANPATGLLSQCAITATGLTGTEGIGFNPTGTFFYSANITGNTISICSVNSATGALSACMDSGATGLSQPDAISFNPDGSILYTSNAAGGVTACLVNATTGLLSACVNNTSVTFSAPADMAVNTAGTLAYVANRGGSSVSVCNVSGQSVSSCNAASGSNISSPEGITLSIDGLHAYVANAGSENVTVCDILQDGTGLLANCSVTGGAFVGTGNVGFNTLSSQAYVPNQLLSAVFVCNVAPMTGQLSGCVPSNGTGFSGPSGVALR